MSSSVLMSHMMRSVVLGAYGICIRLKNRHCHGATNWGLDNLGSSACSMRMSSIVMLAYPVNVIEYG